jgi:hypothetical protein
VSHTVVTFVRSWPSTSRSNNCFLNSIFLSGTLRGDISFRYLKQFFLVRLLLSTILYSPPQSSCKTRTRKYYLKNNYLTLRSKVKISRRSQRYATHRLMVMHSHTKYNWPIWKDKKVMVQTSFAEKKQKKKREKKSD